MFVSDFLNLFFVDDNEDKNNYQQHYKGPREKSSDKNINYFIENFFPIKDSKSFLDF